MPFPSAYFAPPQTAPIAVSLAGIDSLFFILVGKSSGRPFISSAAPLSSPALGSWYNATSCVPDRYGFYRQCLAVVSQGVLYPAADFGSGRKFAVARTWNAEPNPFQSSQYPINGLGANNLVVVRNEWLGYVLVQAPDGDHQSVQFQNLTAPSLRSYPADGADFLTVQGVNTFYKTNYDYSPELERVSVAYFVSPSANTPTRISTYITRDPQQQMADFFLPTPYYVFGSFIFISNWGANAGEDPKIEVLDWASTSPIRTIMNASIGFTVATPEVGSIGFVGPAQYAATTEEFANADDFSYSLFFLGNQSSSRYLSSLGHVYSAFGHTGRPHIVAQKSGAARLIPRSMNPVIRYFDFGLTELSMAPCPGLNLWIEYVRFKPLNQTSGTYYYIAPSDNGPTLWSSTNVLSRSSSPCPR